MLAQIPWYTTYTEEDVSVMDCLNPDKRLKTKIVCTAKAKSYGFMFELAGRDIISIIECPVCGASAVNIDNNIVEHLDKTNAPCEMES